MQRRSLPNFKRTTLKVAELEIKRFPGGQQTLDPGQIRRVPESFPTDASLRQQELKINRRVK